MKTDELINVLSADSAAPPFLARNWAAAIALGLLMPVILIALTFGFRPDLGRAAETWRVLAKFAVTGGLAASCLAMARQIIRPETSSMPYWPAVGTLAVLFGAVAVEMLLVPETEWWARMVGTNALWCLVLVPALSLVPLAIILYVLKYGATTRPGLAGCIAGVMSGALGAAAYALHCADDSPFFIALWYALGIAVVATIGGLLGRRILRW